MLNCNRISIRIEIQWGSVLGSYLRQVTDVMILNVLDLSSKIMGTIIKILPIVGGVQKLQVVPEACLPGPPHSFPWLSTPNGNFSYHLFSFLSSKILLPLLPASGSYAVLLIMTLIGFLSCHVSGVSGGSR